MTLTCCPTPVRFVLGASLLLAIASPLLAQTPPRPAVRINRLPQFEYATWPVDLNGDGRTDVVSASRSSQLQTALGRGDGTFASPRTLSVNAAPMGVGDFNRDGRMDVVVTGAAILPGNGDGTFAAARPVTGTPAPADAGYISDIALVADFDANGTRDLLLVAGTTAGIYPGNGDFTFAPKVTLPINGPAQAIVARLDGDLRPDIALTQLETGTVEVFLNRGGMIFTRSATLPMPSPDILGITTGDLNGDNRRDLLVASSWAGGEQWTQGHVFVMLGNGDGTFRAPVDYATGVRGSITVVVGDFNMDGKLDAATGNRSWRYMGDMPCGGAFQYWDTVTILPGNGDGTFALSVTFNLDFTNEETAYRDSHNTLKTSDVNGDGRTDLIASAGAVLLNVPVAANRPPSVFAGVDRMVDDEGYARVMATVTDPDHDWVSVVWRNESGAIVFDAPELCGTFTSTTTLTVTVTDARGGTASDTVLVFVPTGGPVSLAMTSPYPAQTIALGVPFTISWSAGADPRLDRFAVYSSTNDGRTWTRITECASLLSTARECQWASPGPLSATSRIRVVAYDNTGAMTAFAISERFSVVAGEPTSIPPPWRHRDVGAVGAPGTATFNGTTFTVRGSGADIWGTADEFHYVFTSVYGNFDFTARVTSMEHVHDMVKAGLMVRTDLRAGAPHISLFASPIASRGLRFQRRRTLDGTSVNTTGPLLVSPVWLKLARRGNTVAAYYRKATTDPWRRIGVDSIASMEHGVQVGLAVSSHVDGQLAAATFDNVTLHEVPAWRCEDIGAVGVPGTCAGDSVVDTIEGSGADIWNTADGFRFKYVAWWSDGTITVRVRSIEYTNASAKAGVMFRETLSANSKQVMTVLRPGNGLAMQYRAATGGTTANAAPWRAATAPEWVRLRRAGNTFTGYASNDGVTWVTMGTVTVSMNEAVFVGLPVTSRNNTTLATAVFDDLVLHR